MFSDFVPLNFGLVDDFIPYDLNLGTSTAKLIDIPVGALEQCSDADGLKAAAVDLYNYVYVSKTDEEKFPPITPEDIVLGGCTK